MSEKQIQENHPLLNREDFKRATVDAGKTAYVGGALFYALGRAQLRRSTGQRSSEDIMYCETVRPSHTPEHAVSIPNLRLHLHDIVDEGHIVGKQIEAARSLIGSLLRDDGPHHQGG